MDGSIFEADAVSAASLAGPGIVTRAARWIAEETGGRLVSIVGRKPYPMNSEDCYGARERAAR